MNTAELDVECLNTGVAGSELELEELLLLALGEMRLAARSAGGALRFAAN